MKRVIRFTKYRYYAFALSVLLIVLGIGGVFIQNGFNLGIDFTGGLNKQVQIAPRAMSLTYGGLARAEIDISGGQLSLSLFGEDESRKFVLEEYSSIAALAAALEAVSELEVDYEATGDLPPSRILSLTFPVDLSEESLIVNMRIDSEEGIFSPIEQVRSSLEPLGEFSIQMIGRPIDQEFSLKIPAPGGDDQDFLQQIDERVVELLTAEFGEGTVLLKKTEFIGSIFSEDLVRGAIWSFIIALVLILVYVTVRFKFVFAVSAILALVHDVLIMIGVIGVAQLELSSATIAAFLTIVGYSLNDTIVVFDRIRENTGLMPEVERKTVINTSITQSLSRTTITSLTTFLAVLAIYVFGTGAIKVFAFNLIIGVIVGTYSSIFIASPIVLGWMNLLDRRKKGARTSAAPLKIVKQPKTKDEREEAERIAQEVRIIDQIQAAAAESKAAGGGRIQPSRKKKKKRKKR